MNEPRPPTIWVNAMCRREFGFSVIVPMHNVMREWNTLRIELLLEVWEWLEENAQHWSVVMCYRNCVVPKSITEFEFLDEKTAVLFKLRWG